METFLTQSTEQFVVFLFILVRVSSMLVFAPVFGSQNVPRMIKAALSLLVAMIFAVTIRAEAPVTMHPLGMILRIGGEFLLGAAVGYLATMVFEAVQLGGELAGLQMGFGIVNVIDPLTSVQISLISQLKFIFAVLLFLVINGHHVVLAAIGESFKIIPPGNVGMGSLVGWHFVQLFGEMIILGVKIAAPIVVALLLASFSEGIIARTVPQINIFIVGFGIRIAFGLFVLMISMGFFVLVMTRQFEQLPQRIVEVIGFFQP